MIELAQHIEVLLLENDCVIVPGLGGFVAHYTSAMRMTKENIFLPPTRYIGFNPQLKMNDGLLVQSYMTIYDTNFSDATRIIEKKVKEIFAALHEEGRVDLPNIGELRCSIHGTYEFAPYDNKVPTPYLYGLDSFEMQELAEIETTPHVEKIIPADIPAASEGRKRKFEIKLNRPYLSNIVAMVAVVSLFLFLSTPIKNTEVAEGNYAQILPTELFGRIEEQSLAIHPIVIRQAEAPQTAIQKKATKEKNKKAVVPVAVKEVKVSRSTDQTSSDTSAASSSSSAAPATPVVPAKPAIVQQPKPMVMHHIIIASVGTEKDAKTMTKQLIEKGFPHAKTIVGDGKIRVSIQSCATETEAYQTLNKIRQNETYKDAWVLKK